MNFTPGQVFNSENRLNVVIGRRSSYVRVSHDDSFDVTYCVPRYYVVSSIDVRWCVFRYDSIKRTITEA